MTEPRAPWPNDPFPYTGTLRRIDGTSPYNQHLWALDGDWYWANRHLDRRLSSRFNFGAVALADGRWISGGCPSVYGDESRLPIFPTRIAALRNDAAKVLRLIRYAREWSGFDHVGPEDYPLLVNWVLAIVGCPALEIAVRTEPEPVHEPPVTAGLALFDWGRRRA